MEDPIQVGEWKKISVLGSGAFGVVSLWKNILNEKFVAIKKCKFHTSNNITAKQKARWKNEVDIMKNLSHPNIIGFQTLPAAFEKELLKHNPTKLPLLPMEYCNKGNLRHVLKEPKNLSGLEEQHVRYILEDVSNGLSYLHKHNITHRDVKPDNIVLQHCDNRKDNTMYKIIDLGYAKEIDGTVSFVGTLHYVAPEIFLTQQYNCSVDYWSLGILTFEIICGVLPFLPHLGPFERFQTVKKKGPEDICIYLSYSGRITFSNEVKKEHQISSCLKRNIEIWLQHVLQFDQVERSKNFANGMGVFDYLNHILHKKIVTVLSVYKLEVYSYEIDESTLWDTLKEWISRDTKIPKCELILLLQDISNIDDNLLVTDLLKDQKDIFAFRKSAIISNTITFNFPKLVRESFTDNFKLKFFKQLYAQTVFYVLFEGKLIEAFSKSFDLYLSYMTNLCEDARKKCAINSDQLSKLLMKIDCYNNIRRNNVCDIDLSKNYEYKDCLTYFQRLLSSLERSVSNFGLLQNKIKILFHRRDVMKPLILEMVNIIQGCDMTKQISNISSLLAKKPSDPKTFISQVVQVISDTIKMKDKLIFSRQFRSRAEVILNVVKSAHVLIDWMGQFGTHISELSTAFEQNEIKYRDVLLKAAEFKKNSKIPNGPLSKELLNLPTDYLIKENRNLRYQFNDILSHSIFSHRKYVESTNSLF